jgi:hypothetical protein
MTYKVGDTVWYLDYKTDIPQIKKDIVKSIHGYNYPQYRLEKYHLDETKRLRDIAGDRLFPTKEALLAAIDPSPEPIGYICFHNEDDSEITIRRCYNKDDACSAYIYPDINSLLESEKWL